MAPKSFDLTGNKYGRLKVITLLGKIKVDGKRYWLCSCDCGKEISVRTSQLKGRKSCGCLGLEKSLVLSTKHGMIGTPTYRSWVAMKERCYNQKHPYYYNYGGRGITVCDAWKSSFINFYKDMGERPTNKTLDKIDNNLGYDPTNCRWATSAQQRQNQRPRTKRRSDYQTKRTKLDQQSISVTGEQK